MSDPAKPVQPSFSPPVHPAARFALQVSDQEFILTVGCSRVGISPDTGVPLSEPGVEWLATYCLSPVTAKQLLSLLQNGVSKYEDKAKTTIPVPADSVAALPK